MHIHGLLPVEFEIVIVRAAVFMQTSDVAILLVNTVSRLLDRPNLPQMQDDVMRDGGH